ncbi:MAG: FAD-dependent monooxygenase, partial [Nocardioides sp.]
APHGFEGSRAKGVQPRTLEVFDDLGLLEKLEPRSMHYPSLGLHLGPVTLRRSMIKEHRVTEDVPFANTLLAPQYATDASLRERLEELGGHVEYSTKVTGFVQDDEGVTVSVDGSGGESVVRAKYVVGADGGSSTIRRGAGIAFAGSTDDADRMIVADVTVSGLSRDRWHIWPRKAGRFMGLCPLPDGKFQLMLKLRPGDPADLDRAAVDGMVREFVGRTKFSVEEIHWASVWRPNIRLARSYRAGRVFLAGDAAHVHPPTGGQGLNTGVQDAYNLGWKLGQVLAGASDRLLDTYEAERQPIAARVLGLSSKIYADTKNRPLASTSRGDEERQLKLTYRGGPLGVMGAAPESVVAGDRAPDAFVVDAEGRPTTLFDTFRGPGFTLVSIGAAATEVAGTFPWPDSGAGLARLSLDPSANESFRRIYGLTGDGQVLVRPDGYVACVSDGDWVQSFQEHTRPLVPGTGS